MKNTLLLSIVLLAAAVLCCGCGSQNAAAITEYYLLEAPTAALDGTASGMDGVLKIRHCRAATPFDTRYFLYRTAQGHYEQDYYRQFLTPPNEQITELLRMGLGGRGLFAGVIPASSVVEPDYILEPQLLAIYTDFSDTANPKTVIKMHIVLLALDPDRQDGHIVLEKTYQRSETFQETTGKSIIAGYNAGLENIMTQIAQDFREKAKQ